MDNNDYVNICQNCDKMEVCKYYKDLKNAAMQIVRDSAPRPDKKIVQEATMINCRHHKMHPDAI